VLDYGQLHGYMQYRILETIIGSLVAVIINMIICPAKESPLRKQKIVQLTKQLAQVLQHIAISNPTTAHYNKQLEVARTVVFQSGKESQDLKQAIQNLQYTPFRGKERMYMKDLCLIMQRLERMSVQIRGIARGIVDIHKTTDSAPDISSAIQITATCIEQYGEYVNFPSADKKQALQQCVVKTQTIQRQAFFEIRTIVAAPVLHQLGGIFTDLSRLLDEIEEGLL
jgi:gas vesicle protein